jgi:hypothetical protein
MPCAQQATYVLPPNNQHTRHAKDPMSGHEDIQIPGVYSLTGCRVNALETGNERGYLVRLGKPVGTSANFLATVEELENLRQQIEKATLAGMFG